MRNACFPYGKSAPHPHPALHSDAWTLSFCLRGGRANTSQNVSEKFGSFTQKRRVLACRNSHQHFCLDFQDKVCQIMLAIHDAIYKKGIALESIEARDETAFEALVSSLQEVEFIGPTGPFRFAKNTPDPEYIYHTISQMALSLAFLCSVDKCRSGLQMHVLHACLARLFAARGVIRAQVPRVRSLKRQQDCSRALSFAFLFKRNSGEKNRV